MPVPVKIQHIDKNIWFLNCFGNILSHLYYEAKTPDDFILANKEKISELIEKSNGRYFFAITADRHQERIGKECLKKLNFKPIVSCYSSHNFKSETLTLWVRVRNTKPKVTEIKTISDNDINHLAAGNCSVGIMVENDNKKNLARRLTISTIEMPGFTRVMQTPIYYRILGYEDWGKEVDVDWNKV